MHCFVFFHSYNQSAFEIRHDKEVFSLKINGSTSCHIRFKSRNFICCNKIYSIDILKSQLKRAVHNLGVFPLLLQSIKIFRLKRNIRYNICLSKMIISLISKSTYDIDLCCKLYIKPSSVLITQMYNLVGSILFRTINDVFQRKLIINYTLNYPIDFELKRVFKWL